MPLKEDILRWEEEILPFPCTASCLYIRICALCKGETFIHLYYFRGFEYVVFSSTSYWCSKENYCLLTSLAVTPSTNSGIPGNNRCSGWGLQPHGFIRKSQCTFHLSRLVILSHSTVRQLVFQVPEIALRRQRWDPVSNSAQATHSLFGCTLLSVICLYKKRRLCCSKAHSLPFCGNMYVNHTIQKHTPFHKPNIFHPHQACCQGVSSNH